MKQILLSATLALSLALGVTHATELKLFAGKTYLGCVNCGIYNPDSIWFEHGVYGSKSSIFSIWNEYGPYALQYSNPKPWSINISDAPVVVDRDGNFYGKFTCNQNEHKRMRAHFLDYICENREYATENRREVFFRFFN